MEIPNNELVADLPVEVTNSLSLKTVNELLGLNFYIPAYQRGYRWTYQQVVDLLNDIASFTPKQIENTEEKTWYCLQPLVVKKCDTQTVEKYGFDNAQKCFEVIDGQQRLTTIYLILHYLNQGYVENRRKHLFELNYDTRKDSADFLKNRLNENEVVKSNIDFFHISEAYKTIHNWFSDKGQNFDSNSFESKFLYSTKVIWYKSVETDSIAIFTRINIGKIHLTNAELIKALFLNSSNFKGLNESEIHLKQLEISHEWDNIEYTLQDESFWYFINESENNLDTRIELIFNLLANKPTDKKIDYDNFTFDYFSKKFTKNTQREVIDNWNEVKRLFQTLNEWFNDRVLYHKIGYLISTGEKLGTLLNLSSGRAKDAFRSSLDDKIRDKVNVQLNDLEYPKNSVQIRRVLLLHNIQTMLNNKLEDSRFPFDRYKTENWDIEHINAVAEEYPQTEKHQQDWISEAVKYIKDIELKERAENYKNPDFKTLFNDIVLYFNNEHQVDDTNRISNLVLLDSKTNRGYKNWVFPVKRSIIISRDKSGTFIPICTKNVFLKFYSDEVKQMTFWGEDDLLDYYAEIKKVILNYLPTQKDDQPND